MSANAHSSSSGSYSRGDQMSNYDKLPPSARKALQDAAFDWGCSTIVYRHRKGVAGYKSGKDIAVSVRSWDRAQHRRDAKRGAVMRQL